MTARSGSRSVSASTIVVVEVRARARRRGSRVVAGLAVLGAGLAHGAQSTERRQVRDSPAGRRASRVVRGACPRAGAAQRLRQRGQLGGDAGDVRLGAWPGGPRILSTTWFGRLGQERLVAELRRGLRLLLLGRGQVLGQPLALGRDVDRAGQVERDRRARRPAGSRWRGSPRPPAGGAAAAGWPPRARASAVPSRVEPGRDPLAGLQALVGAEPADLGDDLLELARSPPRRPRRGSRCPPASRR